MRDPVQLQPGQRLARGVCRHLTARGLACLTEFTPARGLRVDVIALGKRGEVWIVECKSSRADLRADRKWQGYLEWCDRYFWAVPPDFDADLLPEGCGILHADDFGAEVALMAPEHPLPPARRKALTRAFAQAAAWRWQALADPGSVAGG